MPTSKYNSIDYKKNLLRKFEFIETQDFFSVHK